MRLRFIFGVVMSCFNTSKFSVSKFVTIDQSL